MKRLLALTFLLIACDDDPKPVAADTSVTGTSETTTSDVLDQDGRPETTLGDEVVTAPSITTEDLGGGATRGRIDATRESGWVRLSLGAGAQVTDASWDLEFQRIIIRVNHPLAVVNMRFEEVTQAPAEGYVEDGDTLDDLAFSQLGEWWNYDLQTHTVSPKAKTFILKIDGETYYKLAVRDYYDDAGTTGLVTLDWASVAKP